MGSWLTYGLGSENSDLPGFVVLLSGENNPDGGKSCWSSGFLPTTYQGVEFRSKGDPVLFLSNPDGVSVETRRQSLDALKDLNQMSANQFGDPEIATRIASYEMSYRMQSSVPELMETSKEPQHIQELYGTEPGKASFANNCLLARRLVAASRAVGADAVLYDAKRNVVLIPCRAGELEVISVADPAHISVVQRVPTQVGSRTATLDPDTGRIYAMAAKFGPPANPGGRPQALPGTFEVLVIAP
jgi:hypothetical protein